MQYTPRYANYRLPPQVKEQPGREKAERDARLIRLLSSIGLPAAGAVAGGALGALVPGGAGIMPGVATGAAVGMGLGGGVDMIADDMTAPHTETDLRRANRRDQLLRLLGGR